MTLILRFYSYIRYNLRYVYSTKKKSRDELIRTLILWKSNERFSAADLKFQIVWRVGAVCAKCYQSLERTKKDLEFKTVKLKVKWTLTVEYIQ